MVPRTLRRPRQVLRYLFVAVLAVFAWSRLHPLLFGPQHTHSAHTIDYGWGSIIHRFQNHPQLARTRHQFPWTRSSLFGTRWRNRRAGASIQAQMRVLIVTSELLGLHTNGGIGTAYAELASTLAGQAHIDVSILVPKLASDYPSQQRDQVVSALARKAITLHFVQPAPHPSYPTGWSPLASIATLRFLRKHDGDYDIIHFAENSGIGYFSILAKHEGIALQNSTIVVGLHGAQIEWSALMNKKYPQDEFDLQLGVMEKRSAELADVVVSPSEYMLEYVGRRGWKLPRHSLVIPNIVQPAAPSINTFRLADKVAPVSELVFFGRLEERKGTRLFIEALELLLAANSTLTANVSRIDTITFLGKDTTDSATGVETSSLIANALMHLQAQSPHPFKYQFLPGYGREDAIAYLQNDKRLTVIPALADNSPSTILECISHSIRFVASNAGGIAELVAPQDQARVLFEPRATVFAAKIAQVVLEVSGPLVRASEHVLEAKTDWLKLHDWINALPAPAPPTPVAAEEMPVVSICITHYERPQFLDHLLKSIAQQTYTKFQVILIDDGSTSAAAITYLDQLEVTHAHTSDWTLIRSSNTYLGEARNKAAAAATGEYLLFLDDDDVLKPHALETMVQVVQHTKVVALSSWLDEFASDEDPLVTTTLPLRRSFWFTGQSLPLGTVQNCFGSGNIFIERGVFSLIGGFSTFREVGAEDWELYMRLATNGYSQLVIPEELIYVRSASSRLSMKFTMDEWDSSYRALLPLLNDPRIQELDLAPSLLYSRSTAIKSRLPPFADLRNDFETIQGWNGWSYSFGPLSEVDDFTVDGQRAVGLDQQWDLSTPDGKAYITDTMQNPAVSSIGEVFAAIRTFTSPRDLDVSLRLGYTAKHQCGDGTILRLLYRADEGSEVQELMVRNTTETGHDIFQHDLSLLQGSMLRLASLPGVTSECDMVEVELSLVAAKDSSAWSTIDRKAQAIKMEENLKVLAEEKEATSGSNWTMVTPVKVDPETIFNIALISDANRLDYVRQVIRSAVRFVTSRLLYVHILCPVELHDDLFAEYHNSSIVLHLYDHELCADYVRHVTPFSSPSIHASAHCKFFLAEILTDVDRVLYLDTDTTILSDLSVCYDVPTLSTTMISMAVDMGDSCQMRPDLCWPIGLHWRVPEGLECGNIKSRPFWKKPDLCVATGDLETIQVNGGVVLMELARMRTSKFVDEYIHSAVHHFNLVGRVALWGEQDFINSYFRLFPDQLEMLPCGCNYQWFGSRREVKCGLQPLTIAHSWAHGLAVRSQNPYNVLFHHFLDNIPAAELPVFPRISDSAAGSTNSSELGVESYLNCPLQAYDCQKPFADGEYGLRVFVLSRAISGAFIPDLVDSVGSQSYANIQHIVARPETQVLAVTNVSTMAVALEADLSADYALLCKTCSSLAASSDPLSCHVPPTTLVERRAYFDCACELPDSTTSSRYSLNAFASPGGWILWLDDDRMFVARDSLAHIMAAVDAPNQMIVFRANTTSNAQEANYKKKLMPSGELEGTGFLFHSSHMGLRGWYGNRCGISSLFDTLAKTLQIKWLDTVPVIEHPLMRHRYTYAEEDFRVTIVIFHTRDNVHWWGDVVADLRGSTYASLVKEVVILSSDLKSGMLGEGVRIVNPLAGSGLLGAAGLASTAGVLLLSDSVKLNKVSLRALINFWLDNPLRPVGVFTPLSATEFPPPLIVDESSFDVDNEADALVGSPEAEYYQVLPRVLLTHAFHLDTLASSIEKQALHPSCHNILLHAIAAESSGTGPLRILLPPASVVDRVYNCRIRSWAHITEGVQVGDEEEASGTSAPTYAMCVDQVSKILGRPERAWLRPTTEIGVAGVQGMKVGMEEGSKLLKTRWQESRVLEACLKD